MTITLSGEKFVDLKVWSSEVKENGPYTFIDLSVLGPNAFFGIKSLK
jgi:hypothetical protein